MAIQCSLIMDVVNQKPCRTEKINYFFIEMENEKRSLKNIVHVEIFFEKLVKSK